MINTKTAPYAALLLRTSLGIMFLAHAGLKVFVFTPAGTVGYFESLGLPGLLAYVTIAAEIVGGVMLMAGAYTRIVSASLIPLLLGTIILVHGASGWAFGNEGGGWEYPAFLIAACVVQTLLGGGAYSLKSFNPSQRSAFA